MQFELTKEYIETLRDAIERNAETSLIALVSELHPADLAEVMEELEAGEALVLYKVLDADRASDVLTHFEDDRLKEFLGQLTSKEIAEQFIDHLDSDDAADMINVLPEEQKEEVIAHIEDKQQAQDIVDLLHYEEETAGALMAKELIKVNVNWTVSMAVKEMRKQAEKIDQVYTVYVVNDDDVLLGRLSLNKLLLNPVRAKIEEIYDDNIRSVNVDEDQEDVATIMEKYDLVALPVVDELNRLLGRITIDDVVDVIKEEAEKDYALASGISGTVESTDSVFVLTRARLPWLLIGLFGGILGARVIELYEGDLQLYPEMAFFIPLIAAMGGNVGVQSSAIIVQGLANNSLGLSGIWAKLSKEFSVALLNGAVCAIIIFGYNFFFSDSLELSMTVSLALFSVILVAALFGTFIPLLLDKYDIDPALATGPFITTVNDVLGLFIYFLIGHLLYIQ
ncbi:magnesium transporter [Salibacteraceae bacterium]|jgi:magnesium transporter|nr:magnesium transporter [Salibacteraceae bacterium]HAW19158.1 magnesium transporter [Flavobacteriales bacterium]